MTEDRLLTFEHSLDQDATETIEVSNPCREHLTFTGSFDVKVSRAGSFTKLLNALPIPTFLVDGTSTVRFANAACSKITADYEQVHGLKLTSLLSPEHRSLPVQSILDSVFSTRKPHVAEGTVSVGSNAIWGRIHFRSLRMDAERSVLVLVEDLTHERRQLVVNRHHREELLKAHAQLEQRVQERTAELREINERLKTEIAERKRAEEDLRRTQEMLELRVDERTAALKETNERLRAEMAQRADAEEALRRAHQELEERVEERTKQLVDANRRLELEIGQRKTAEDGMRESLRDKEALLQEVHHRVKNNLQIISSLLALQATHVSDGKTLGVLQDSQSRIRSMAFIHEHLYQSKDLARINFSQYISDLVSALLQSYSEMAARVSLTLELDPTLLGVGTALPCGLIINEIVSNCLKHAFPDGRSGQIRVSLRRRPEETYELVVVDDGIGFPPRLSFRESESLGLRLVKNLTEVQLKGAIEMRSNNGSEVRIVFRDHTRRKDREE